MAAHTKLRLRTVLEELQKIEPAVDELSQAEEWAPDLEFKVKLLLDELCTNVINYAHDDGEVHEFSVELVSDDESVRFEIIDSGRPFNPLVEAPEPDTGAALDDRRIGGLGVYFVKTMVDEARYRREDGRNCLTLVKRRE